MNRSTYVIASSLLAALSLAFVPAEAELVRHALCTDGDETREIELRSIDGVAGVCDIVERTVGQFTEERTTHSAAARSDYCAMRFDNVVGALSRRGWRCSPTSGASASENGWSLVTVPPSSLAARSFASTWRDACAAAQATKNADDPGALCDCAVEAMSAAGFEERDFEVLVSPYDQAGVERPMQREGLPDGVGMMAVDALARCGAR